MSNKVFEALLIEQIEIFRKSFSDVSRRVFFDDKQKKLRHSGEYGMYREAICKDFLKFVIPSRLDIEQGFVINTYDEVSTQCDIIVYDSKSTPLIQAGERQRFFPIETVCAVGEVKSKLSKNAFKKAVNKLSNVKKMRENIKNPTIIRREMQGEYNPSGYSYDQIFTFLICEKLDFNLENIVMEINELYEDNTLYRHRHNLILSLEDGILFYYDETPKSMMYPVFRGKELKNRFAKPETNKLVHYKLFASYMFLGTSSTTILYPEITDYMGSITGGSNINEL